MGRREAAATGQTPREAVSIAPFPVSDGQRSMCPGCCCPNHMLCCFSINSCSPCRLKVLTTKSWAWQEVGTAGCTAAALAAWMLLGVAAAAVLVLMEQANAVAVWCEKAASVAVTRELCSVRD
jgi:hypothetical protein